MTRQQFLEEFQSALSDQGASPEFIDEQSALISGKIEALSDTEFEKSANGENIAMLARSSMEEYLSRTRHTQEKEPEVQDENEATIITRPVSEKQSETPAVTDEETKKIDTVPEKEASSKDDSFSDKGDDIVTVDMTPIVSHKKKTESDKKSFIKRLTERAENKSSTLIFTVLTVLAFPLILFGSFVAIGVLFGLYFALAALVVALIFGIIAVVCGGGLTSIVALLYGATQIMQEPRYVGMHEIGFALIVAGATILVSVLLYNVAIKLIPWILSKASVIFKALVVRVKRIAEKARKGCEKL